MISFSTSPSAFLKNRTVVGAISKKNSVLKDSARLRDTIIGDFDRTHQGLEALVVGSSAKVIQLYAENGEWKTKSISQLSEPLARIAAGELLEKFQGPEVVLAGDKGGVYLLKQVTGIFFENNNIKE